MAKKHGSLPEVKEHLLNEKTCNKLTSISNLGLVFTSTISFNCLCSELSVSIYQVLALGSSTASSGHLGQAFPVE